MLQVDLHERRIASDPGAETELTVELRNTGLTQVTAELRVVGADIAPPMRVTLAPDEHATPVVRWSLPSSYPAGSHAMGVEVRTIGGRDDGRVQVVDFEALVGDAARVAARLDPRHVHRGSRFEVVLQNSAAEPVHLELRQDDDQDLVEVTFSQRSVTIPPGGQLRVRGKAKLPRKATGDGERRAFTVVAQHRSTPIYLTGTVARRVAIPSRGVRATALLAVFALWVGAVVVGVQAIRDRIGDQVDEDRNTLLDDEIAARAGDDGGGGGDTDGTGTVSATPVGVRIGGTVHGDAPDGVAVTLRPLSEQDAQGEAATGTPVVQTLRSTKGKLVGPAAPTQRAEVQTSTRDGGLWAFADVPGPGYFVVEFAKVGYETRSFVIEIGPDLEPVVLDMDLEAGDGSLSGVVTGDGAPLGGARVTVSDGTTVASTTTPTSGDVGTWAFLGLDTPAQWVITVERDGFGTEVRTVDLGASSSETLNIDLAAGVGSLSGSVRALRLGADPLTGATDGIEGATVTLTADDLERSTTTVGAEGTFALPRLPLGTEYTVAVEVDGFLAQSQTVTLTEADPNTTLVLTLRPDSGSVQGLVLAVPIWTSDDEAANPGTGNTVGKPVVGGSPEPVSGVGLTLSDETMSFKTVSNADPDANIAFANVPAGTYVLTTDLFNHATSQQLITVAAGEVTNASPDGTPITLTYEERPLPATGSISGFIVNATTGERVSTTIRIRVDDADPGGAPYLVQDARGLFSLQDLAPGVRRITLFDADATGQRIGKYELLTQPIRIAPGQQIDNFAFLLRELPDVEGTIVDAVDGLALSDARICAVRIPSNENDLPAMDRADPTGACDPQSIDITDASGAYQVPDLADGDYMLRVSALGYDPLQKRVRVSIGVPIQGLELPMNRLPAIQIRFHELNPSAAFPATRAITSGGVSVTPANGGKLYRVKAGTTLAQLSDRRPTANVEITTTGTGQTVPAPLTSADFSSSGIALAYVDATNPGYVTGTAIGLDAEFRHAPASRYRWATRSFLVNEVTDYQVTMVDPDQTIGRVFYDYPVFTPTGTSAIRRGAPSNTVSATGIVDLPTRVDPTQPAEDNSTTTTRTLTAVTDSFGEFVMGQSGSANWGLITPNSFIGGVATFVANSNGSADFSAFTETSPSYPDIPVPAPDDCVANGTDTGACDVLLELTPKKQRSLQITYTGPEVAASQRTFPTSVLTVEHAGGEPAVAQSADGLTFAIRRTATSTDADLAVGEYRVSFTDPDGRYVRDPDVIGLDIGQSSAPTFALTRTVSVIATVGDGQGTFADLDTGDASIEVELARMPLGTGQCNATGFTDIVDPSDYRALEYAPTSGDHGIELTGLPSGQYCLRATRTLAAADENGSPIVQVTYAATNHLNQASTFGSNGFSQVLPLDFTRLFNLSGSVQAYLGLVRASNGGSPTDIGVTEEFAGATVRAHADFTDGGIRTVYSATTTSAGTPVPTSLVVDDDAFTDPLDPSAEAGTYRFVGLPFGQGNIFGSTYTHRVEVLAVQTPGGQPAYLPRLSQGSITYTVSTSDIGPERTVDPLLLDAVPASFTVRARSDAGVALPNATMTLTALMDALPSRTQFGDQALPAQPLSSTDSITYTETTTDLAPVVYRLQVSASNHADVVRYVYLPAGQTSELDLALPALRTTVTGSTVFGPAGNRSPVAGAQVTVVHDGTTTPVLIPAELSPTTSSPSTLLPSGESVAPLRTHTASDGSFTFLVGPQSANVAAIPRGVAVDFLVSAPGFADFRSPGANTFGAATANLAPFVLTGVTTPVVVVVQEVPDGQTTPATPASNLTVRAVPSGGGSTQQVATSTSGGLATATFGLTPGNWTIEIAERTRQDASDFLEAQLPLQVLPGGTTVPPTPTIVQHRAPSAQVRLAWADPDAMTHSVIGLSLDPSSGTEFTATALGNGDILYRFFDLQPNTDYDAEFPSSLIASPAKIDFTTGALDSHTTIPNTTLTRASIVLNFIVCDGNDAPAPLDGNPPVGVTFSFERNGNPTTATLASRIGRLWKIELTRGTGYTASWTMRYPPGGGQVTKGIGPFTADETADGTIVEFAAGGSPGTC